MSVTLPPHFIELVYDAVLKSYWRKKALKAFLRRSQISENFLAQLDESESKRDWLDRLFPKLEASERGRALIQQMARSLAEQKTFPDLENSEGAAEKVEAAKRAIASLKTYFDGKEQDKASQRERELIRQKARERQQAAMRSQTDLTKLRDRLDALATQIGTQEGGYEFQTWFYDFMEYSEIDCRRPYTVNGRQIDGSITVDGTTYLVELKFTKGQSDATDVDSLISKVSTKADNTMGILVGMSGYSSVAVSQASHARSPVMLLDFSHLYLVLGGTESFADVVRRIRRHFSQTGNAYLPANEFGG